VLKLVYLAGKIDGLSWDEANSWREKATKELELHNISVYNPLPRNLEGVCKISPDLVQGIRSQIPANDEFYLKCSDVLLVNLGHERLTGTLLEIGYARALGKMIVGFGSSKLCKHPFIERWVDLRFETLDDALEYIIDLFLRV